MITREQVVAEALTWVDTPYLHQAMVKGERGGTDCAMINVAIFRDFAKLAPPDADPRPYPMQWHLHRGEERYLNWFKKYAREVTSPELADIALFRFGRTVSHSGIVVADDVMVHAFRDANKVIRENISAHSERLHSFWSLF